MVHLAEEEEWFREKKIIWKFDKGIKAAFGT